MDVNPYVSFEGDCEEALTFYARCLGGTMGPLFRYGDSPEAGHAPDDWSDKIMHGSVKLGGLTLMGSDVTPDRYESPRGISLSVHVTSASEAERAFDELARGGRVLMPIQQTFWASRFGMLTDRFGVSWMVNCEDKSAPPAA